jgi:tryptophan-rich sensory protein
MSWMDWYQSLAKPSWTPEPRTIGLIWQVLYPVILATFGFVFVQAGRGTIPWLIALPFAINLVANLLFTPIQRWLEVLETRGHIEDGKIAHWQVRVKIGATLDD